MEYRKRENNMADKKLEFRLLNADEIEVRVGHTTSNGAILLLYKDARCDMNILDETVGCLNWQRHHSRDNANCIVSIWDAEKKQWIEKEDTGTESNTQAEKGLASDSFKRACTNLGIGRELYTAPLIYIDKDKFKDKYEKFHCTDIKYEGRRIKSVAIYIESTKEEITFTHKVKKPNTITKVSVDDKVTPPSEEEEKYNSAKAKVEKYNDKSLIDEATQNKVIELLKARGQDESKYLKHFGISKWSELDVMRATVFIDKLSGKTE